MTAKIVTLDVETIPAVVETWTLHGAYIGIEQIREPGRIIGLGYKWHDSSRAYWTTDVAVEAQQILHEADIVIGYNTDSFDLKHLNREIVLAGLTPPSPYKSVDLYKIVKKNFKFQSNKLDFVAQQLGVGRKASTGGYDLWKRCMAGDEAAWRKMAAYCRQDCRVTEALYDRLIPWIKGLDLTVWTEDGHACPACTGKNVIRQGERKALSMTYQRWSCTDCGSWSQSRKGVSPLNDLRPA